MPVCPLCEHAQDHGDLCDVCGRRLTDVGGVADPVEPLEGLQPTRAEATPDALPEPLEDLQPTRFDSGVADVSGWIEPDAAKEDDPTPREIVPTARAPVGAVTVEAVDVERTALDEKAPATLPSGPRTCRYCRTPQSPDEVFCAKCGMKHAPVAASESESAAPRRCLSCGSIVGTEERCRVCGAVLREADAV